MRQAIKISVVMLLIGLVWPGHINASGGDTNYLKDETQEINSQLATSDFVMISSGSGPQEIMRICLSTGEIWYKGRLLETDKEIAEGLEDLVIDGRDRLKREKEELLDALRLAGKYLERFDDPQLNDLVYRTPSQEVRERADRIEQRDADIKYIQGIIDKYTYGAIHATQEQ